MMVTVEKKGIDHKVRVAEIEHYGTFFLKTYYCLFWLYMDTHALQTSMSKTKHKCKNSICGYLLSP